MIEDNIHNIIISYDDTQYQTSHFVAYLKNDEMKEKIHEYCVLARKSFDFQIEIKGNRGYDFILKYVGEDKFTLTLKKS